MLVAFSLDYVHTVIHDRPQSLGEGTNPYRTYLHREKEKSMLDTRCWRTLAVGIMLMGLCLGVTGALAQIGTVEVTSATVDTFGEVTVSVTVTCAEDFTEVFLDIFVSQPVGRTRSVEGGTLDETAFSCAADETVSFTEQIIPFEGRFGPGKARVFTGLFSEDPCCTDQEDSTPVRLRRQN
jgi:hypothetical protein